MNPVELIRKKREGEALTREELSYFVRGAVAKQIPEYQVSAFLMAVFFKGMTPAETAVFTEEMIASGERVEFLDGKPKIDKHSTGGVGDKVSLILAPLVAALGVDVPMVSGRGLGHTGGTLDKLESIAGFSTTITTAKFKELVREHGLAMMGQTSAFVPADKLFYALRDVTATVESIPLITASILSKKVAEGIDGLVMDIKTGSGAFMESQKDAEALARSIVATGTKLGLKVRALITDMSQPLGRAVGHTLEVLECIDVMEGKGPNDLREITAQLAAQMLVLGKRARTVADAKKMALKSLSDGSALSKFGEMCVAQGARTNPVSDRGSLKVSANQFEIRTSKTGKLAAIDTRELGMTLVELGGGRKTVADKIDFTVGYLMQARLGQKLTKNQPLMTVYYNPERTKDLAAIEARLKSAFTVGKTASAPKLLRKVI